MSLAVPAGPHCLIAWTGIFVCEQFEAEAHARGGKPYATLESKPNLLLTAGATALFNRLAGLGSVTAFDGTNGRLCVGNGNTAAAVGQTDLQGGSKTRKVFDAAPTISTNTYTAVTTFGTGDANYAWEEAGVANSASGAVLLNRVAQSFGTKNSSLTWVLTFIGTLA